MLLELIGYLGSALVVVSLMMSSVVKLRIFNTTGSLVSATYAFIIRSYPLALMNICIILINTFNLIKLLGSNKQYDLLETDTDETYLTYFLNHYKKDIAEFFPKISGSISKGELAYIVCCDAAPVGLLMGKMVDSETLEVTVDYAIPKYRDCSIGSFLYDAIGKKGIRKLVCRDYGEKHVPYMKKMGFESVDGAYEKIVISK